MPEATLRLSTSDLETLVHAPGTSSVLLKLQGQMSAAQAQAVTTSILSLRRTCTSTAGRRSARCTTRSLTPC